MKTIAGQKAGAYLPKTTFYSVTSDASGSGFVGQYNDGVLQKNTAISESSTVTFGPFYEDTTLEITALTGELTHFFVERNDGYGADELTWPTKPTAGEFGVGQAWFSDIGAMGYSDGVSWSLNKLPYIKKTNGITIASFANGIADLVANTPGAGATISTPADGDGIRIQQSSGVDIQTSLTFNVTPYLIEADTIVGVLMSLSDAAKTDNIDLYVTTQASNFAGYCNVNSAIKPATSMIPLGGGLCLLQWTGAAITTTPHGNGTVTVGTIIDRMRIVIKCSQDQDVEIKSVVINPIVKPAFPIYFDDGHASQYKEAFSYMSKKDLRGTIAVVGSFVGNGYSVTLAQLQEMYDAGWDLVNHTYTHFGVNTTYGGAAPNQIAQAQTVSAGNDFILNGAVGSAVFDVPRCLVFTHVGNDIAKRILVTGLGKTGDAQTEVIMGVSGSTDSRSEYVWTKITSINAIDALASNVTIGLSASYQAMYDDILANKSLLAAQGFSRGLDCYVAPGGQRNALLYEALSALGITKMRTTSNYYQHPFLCPNPLGLPSFASGIASGGSATVIAIKDAVKSRWTTNSLYLHEIVDDSVSPSTIQARLTDFRLVIDSIAGDVKAGDLLCPTMSEFVGMCGY